jgi:exosortase
MTPPAPRCTAIRALPWLAKINAAALCSAVAGFAVLLWPQWRHDDNLTHGIFLPFLASILVAESRRDPSPRFLRPGSAPLALCAILSLAGLASFAVAIIYAAAVGWSHAMAEFMVSVALVFALGAAWLGFADPSVRFLPLNWAAGVAVGLWLLAGPLPPGTYARLALFLQTQVTDGVVRVLNALGTAAYRDGNVIELARTSVGVSEACSGVRSLISCTVAGLFLSGVLVRRPAHRALVIAVSPAIGLAMNFLRSLLLTLLVNSGVEIEGRWHDLTGASILVVTTLLVTAFALWLHRREPAPAAPPPGVSNPPTERSPLQVVLAASWLVAAGAAGFIAAAGSESRSASGPAPDLAALLPPPPPGWTAQTTVDLDQYSGVLQTHNLIERVYSDGPAPGNTHLTLYLAYWRPGQAPVSLVDAHTPDACWPGTGWLLDPSASARAEFGIGSRTLPPAESRLFVRNGFETRVWFWHLYGGRPLTFVDPYSAPRLLGLALRYGFGDAKDQLFVRVSSNRPWQEIASGPTLRQFVENLKPLGL